MRGIEPKRSGFFNATGHELPLSLHHAMIPRLMFFVVIWLLLLLLSLFGRYRPLGQPRPGTYILYIYTSCLPPGTNKHAREREREQGFVKR